MPKIQWERLPREKWAHLRERAKQRQISQDDLFALPDVPDGDWFKDFGTFQPSPSLFRCEPAYHHHVSRFPSASPMDPRDSLAPGISQSAYRTTTARRRRRPVDLGSAKLLGES